MISPHPVDIRFSDIDAFGHVHNAAYFQYFESARLYYFSQLLGEDWDWNRTGIMLVENYAQYLKPLLLNDQAKISLHVTKIGNKSFSLEYQLSVNDKIHCMGKSKLVCFDHLRKASITLPEKFKRTLEDLK